MAANSASAAMTQASSAVLASAEHAPRSRSTAARRFLTHLFSEDLVNRREYASDAAGGTLSSGTGLYAIGG